MTAGGVQPKSIPLNANPQTIPVANCFGDGLAGVNRHRAVPSPFVVVTGCLPDSYLAMFHGIAALNGEQQQ